MASYETEFLQALNMASQSASGLLKSIREPDYEEKLAMETAKRKELMDYQQDIDIERREDDQGFKTDTLSTTEQGLYNRLNLSLDSNKDLQKKRLDFTGGENNKDRELRDKMQVRQIDSAKTLQDDMQEFKFTFQDSQNDFTMTRDKTLHGYAIDQMNLGHSLNVDMTNINHKNELDRMLKANDINKDLHKFLSLEVPRYQRMSEEERQGWLNEKIDYKDGNSVSKKTRAEVYMLGQNKLAQSQAENNFEWQKGNGFKNWVASGTNGFITFDGTGMQMQTAIQNEKYQKRSVDFNQNINDDQYNIAIGRRFTEDRLFKDMDPTNTNAIMTSLQGQSALYGNMNLDSPESYKAIFNQQSFTADAAVASLNIRTADFDAPDKPFFSAIRGDNAHNKYLTEGTNSHNDITANLLKRSEMLSAIGLNNASSSFKDDLEVDINKGIKLGENLIKSAKKVGADKNTINALMEKNTILETYLNNLNAIR